MNSRVRSAVVKQQLKQQDHKGLIQFEHINIIKVKRRPFTNSQRVELFPPVYLEANMPNLQSVLKVRFLKKNYFSAGQLATLMRSILNGLAFLEKQNIKFGDIHPSNIFYDQLNDNYKIGNPLYCFDQVDLMRTKRRGSLLSPERIGELYSGKSSSLTVPDSFKSDIFTLGLHIVQFGNLSSAQKCYNQELMIIEAQIQNCLVEFHRRYGDKLTQFVQSMLTFQSHLRPSSIQLAQLAHEQLSVYDQEDQMLGQQSRISYRQR